MTDDPNMTPEERRERELDEQGKRMLEAIRADRERQARMQQWLRERVEAGYEAKAEDERRQREQ